MSSPIAPTRGPSPRAADTLLLHAGFPRLLPPMVAQILDVVPQHQELAHLDLEERQRRQALQLARLLEHARRYSTFWRARLAPFPVIHQRNALSILSQMPQLTRAELQTNYELLKARSPDMHPSAIQQMTTSGSTGRPVTVDIFAPVHSAMYSAVSLFDDVQHQRDADLNKATVRDLPDATFTAWHPVYEMLGKKGNEHRRNMIDHPPEALFDWLLDVQPTYVRTLPAIVAKLVEIAQRRNTRLPFVQQFMTFAETVTPQLRAAVRRALGGKIVDCYSCEEAGWIALQCPQHDHYHVASAVALVEIIDDVGHHCPPGRAGKVLVTALHSYAMPLIRYDIGDLAEWGPACTCGMTLPVIANLWGRQRSFVRLPDGTLKLARVTAEYWREIAPVDEYRVVQYADGLIEAFITMPRTVSPSEREAMQAMLCRVFGYPLETIVTQVTTINWQHRTKRIDVLRLDYNRPG